MTQGWKTFRPQPLVGWTPWIRLLGAIVLLPCLALGEPVQGLQAEAGRDRAPALGLLTGTIIALLIHFAAMHTVWGQIVLEAAPVSLETWSTVFLLALLIFPVMELHKWSWNRRYPVAATAA